MHLLYSLLFTLGVLISAPYYLWRLRGRIACVSDWRERLGFLPARYRQPAPGAIWVHAVSVGETLAIVGMVRDLRKRYPERKIFVSHVTQAGRAAGETRLPDVAGRFLLPLDWSVCVRRAMQHIRPELLVLVETELWPNLLRAAREQDARIVVVNARLSDRSFPRYRLVRLFIRRVLRCVDTVCAQSETDAARFRALGASSERVVVSGNLKFDAQPPAVGELAGMLKQVFTRSNRGPVIVAASTMPGEEDLLFPAWEKVRREYPKALLILAPRHPARFEEVARQLAERRLNFLRRTALAGGEPQVDMSWARAEVLLLDTIGELAGIFELADVVFMGGTLVPTGGHNLLEPAYWGKPIVFGAHMHNFRDMVQLFLAKEAARQVPDAGALGPALLELLRDPALRIRLGQSARQVLDEQRGATERVLQVLAPWLERPVVESRAVGTAP